MKKALFIVFGILSLVLFFDILVIFRNGISPISLGGLIVPVIFIILLIRDTGKDAQKAREAKAAREAKEAKATQLQLKENDLTLEGSLEGEIESAEEESIEEPAADHQTNTPEEEQTE